MNAKIALTETTNIKEPEPVTTATATKENAFAGASDALGAGIDALFADQGAQYSLIPLDMIQVKTQIRESFEDEENTLEDLAASIKVRGVLQPILLRPNSDGYELIAGERRYRASKLAGLEQIPAYIREMSDEEAEDAQMAENIQRKNLTQIEEAKKIQRDLDKLGSVDAVLEKHQKSRPWLSKMLALLNLPEQAKRLVMENVSADVEVINTVKMVEKINPVKAKELVEDLKRTRGKENARDKVAAIKAEVKPSNKPKPDNGEKTQKGRSHEESDQLDVFAGAKFAPFSDAHNGSESPRPLILSPVDVLNNAYTNIFKHGISPNTILEAMPKDEKDRVEGWLHSFYDAGNNVNQNVARSVIQGFRNGNFSIDGNGAFALVAFLDGAQEAEFYLLNVLASVMK